MSCIRAIAKVLLLMAALTLTTVSAEEISIDAWNYYHRAPFVTGENEGLSHDFVSLLNHFSMNRYKFKLTNVTRKRLDLFLETDQIGVALFVNPKWMGEGAEERYLWSKPLLSDQNEVISSIHKEIIFDGAISLKGLSFVGIHGRKYYGLEALFTTNKISRTDLKQEEQLLKMVSSGRYDVTTLPRSMAGHLADKLDIRNQLFFSPTPLFSYTRHILVPRNMPEVLTLIDEFVLSLTHNPEWRNALKKYQLVQ